MNTAGLSYLGAKAKPTAEAIARWCEREGIGYEFLPARGGHPSVRLSLNRQSRKVFFSGSPSAVGSVDVVISDCKRAARVMGWTPRKETRVETIVRTFSDLPKVVETAPADVQRTNSSDTQIPRPPKKYVGEQIPSRHFDKDLTLAIQVRNDWTWDQKQKGRTSAEIYDALTSVGWMIKSPANIDATISVMRQKKGLSKPRADKSAFDEPETISAKPIDPLVLALAEAIAPMLQELKAKADKWDAIAGLVKDA